MTTRYSVIHRGVDGNIITRFSRSEFSVLDYTLKTNNIGVLYLELPPKWDISRFSQDDQLEVYRGVGSRALRLEGDQRWFIEMDDSGQQKNAQEFLKLTAHSATTILDRRDIAYNEGTIYTEKIDFLDDIMKDIIRENYGVAALDADRDISAVLSVQTNTSEGFAGFVENLSRRDILEVLEEITAQNGELGTELFFDLVVVSDTAIEFRIFFNQRGTDRGSTSSAPIFVSPEKKNLTNPIYTQDWREEKNYIYVCGEGSGVGRVVEELGDADRIAISPYNRREGFVDGGNTSLAASLNAMAEAELYNKRPVKILTGNLVETDAFQYGVHYFWGDVLAARYQSLEVDAHVEIVNVRVDSRKETIISSLRGEI